MTLRSSDPARSATSPPSSGTRSRWACPAGSPVVPTTTSEPPSGVQTSAWAVPPSSPTRRADACGVRASTTWSSSRVCRSRSAAGSAEKAIRVPSGLHANAATCQSPVVTRRHSPDARSTTCRWRRRVPRCPEPSARYADPVADERGDVGPLGALPLAGPRCRPGRRRRSDEPSGLHCGAPAPSGRWVSCSASPPSAGRHHSCAGPSPPRRNASRSPSGDQLGAPSASPRVSRAGDRSGPTRHTRSRVRSDSASTVRSV